MRIAYVVTELGIGGAEMMLLKLVSRIDRGRFDPVVVSLGAPGRLAPEFEAIGVPVLSLGMGSAPGIAFGVVRLIRVLRKLKPDLVQGWMVHGNFAATLATAVTRSPLVWGVRHSRLDPSVEKRSTVLIERLLAALSGIPRRIVYNSHAGRALHEALGYSARKGSVVPNGFDTARFQPDPVMRGTVRRELGIDEERVLAGIFARRHPMKDHALLLDALAAVLPVMPTLMLLVVGEGCEPDNPGMRKLIDDRGLAANVLALGPRTDVERLTAAIDIAVSSSRAVEGFSNAIGEAMASGVPCVVTDVGDAAAIVGDTGLVVPPSDAKAFADALRRLASLAAAERRAMGTRARARIVQKYSIDAVARQYETLYGAILEERM